MSATASRNRATLLGAFFGSPSTGITLDAALVFVRVVLAWVFIYYGGAKLFGAFPGAGPHGLHQTALYLEQAAGLSPGKLFAIVGGVVEFGGGIAMAIGFFSRLAGLALFCDMVIAMITVTWATGINSVTSPPGYQLNIAMAVLALVVVFLGPGRLSVDAVIARRLRGGTGDPRPAASRAREGTSSSAA